MPLTPADIKSIEFRTPPQGVRGYDQEEVDAFLERAGRELTRLNGQNRALRERLRQSAATPEHELAAAAADLERLRAEQARAEEQARAAAAELERARDARRAPAGDGRRSSDSGEGVLAVARRTADDYLRTAEEEAANLLAAARDKAAQVTSEAELRAATIDSDARHRHAEAVSALDDLRAAALAEIDRLGELVRDRRGDLHDRLARRLSELIDAGRT
ncbi:DivIVA domain-containing protein [Actinoplanes sp. NPDC023801]|uniref:DivIVA domain-containing protein n=1 Tax=Actinoplanes sp. NPDC023801 TaxID=3154595 RepID=UPI0033F8D510